MWEKMRPATTGRTRSRLFFCRRSTQIWQHIYLGIKMGKVESIESRYLHTYERVLGRCWQAAKDLRSEPDGQQAALASKRPAGLQSTE